MRNQSTGKDGVSCSKGTVRAPWRPIALARASISTWRDTKRRSSRMRKKGLRRINTHFSRLGFVVIIASLCLGLSKGRFRSFPCFRTKKFQLLPSESNWIIQPFFRVRQRTQAKDLNLHVSFFKRERMDWKMSIKKNLLHGKHSPFVIDFFVNLLVVGHLFDPLCWSEDGIFLFLFCLFF